MKPLSFENTEIAFQSKSTKCPSGIFNTHGKPAQNPKPARNAADKFK